MVDFTSLQDEFEHVRCNVCGADDTRLLLTELGLTIVKCRRCSLIYVNPRLTGESRTRYYKDLLGVRSNEVSSLLPESDMAYAAAIAACYAKTDYHAMNKYAFAVHRQILLQISEIVPRGRFLDIGCGWGYLLKRAREEFGYEVYGLEPSNKLAEACRNQRGLKEVFQGTLEEAEYPPDYFDVVTLSDVLEHLPDPTKALAKISDMLRPGGVVFIKVPNANYLELKTLVLAKTGFARRLGIMGPAGLMNPRVHLYNFSQRSLGQLLSKHGFEPKKFLSFGGGRMGISRRDHIQRVYSLLAWLAKMLSAGHVDLYHSFGVIAILPGQSITPGNYVERSNWHVL
ncbi:class I SAM-dependent methyltransferase [Chloroflexota bacterium]